MSKYHGKARLRITCKKCRKTLQAVQAFMRARVNSAEVDGLIMSQMGDALARNFQGFQKRHYLSPSDATLSDFVSLCPGLEVLEVFSHGRKDRVVIASGSGVHLDLTPLPMEHMTMQDALKLKVHDKIDHRDLVGRFLFATVSDKQGTNLKIHYDGWSRKWDTWCDIGEEIHRFAIAAPGLISKRPAHRFEHLKKGDYVDINPTQRHPGWKCGEIRRLDQKSGQVQVVYEWMNKNWMYWAHLDDTTEIAEFTSQSEIQQDLYKSKQCSNQRVAATDTDTHYSQFTPFPNHMTRREAFRLKVNDKIDHRDIRGQFVLATVTERRGTNLMIHYDKVSGTGDTWSDFRSEIHRFAAPGSISKRPAHRFQHLKVGDSVDINPRHLNPGWKRGKIHGLFRDSGQVWVIYEMADKSRGGHIAHLDDITEIAEFKSKTMGNECSISDDEPKDNCNHDADQDQNEEYPVNLETLSNELQSDVVDDLHHHNRKDTGISVWFRDIVHLPQYCELFESQGFEEMVLLFDLTDGNLKELGIDKMGHRIKILKAIEELKNEDNRNQGNNNGDSCEGKNQQGETLYI